MFGLAQRIEQLISGSIETMGYELVGVDFRSGARHNALKIYIDATNGVNLNDCGDVSQQVSAILNVEQPISGPYTLEVSSPGVNRVLFKLAHYQRFLGHQVNLRFKRLVNGRRKLLGKIIKVDDKQGYIHILSQREDYAIDIGDIDKAHLAVH